MSDNTPRPLTSGGDTIRSDDAQDLSTGTALDVKHQVFKIGLGATDIDGGLASPANPFPATGGLFAEVSGKLTTVVDLLTARALRRARAKGAAQPAPPPIGGAGASVFNPLSVTGCAVWYDLTRCSNAGGFLTALPDQSGNACDAVIAGPSEPTFTASYKNGLPAMTFPAVAATFVDTPNSLGVTTGARTFVIVCDVGAVDNTMIVSASSAANYLRGFGGNFDAGDGGTVIDTPLVAATPTILIWVNNGAASKLYASALTPATGTTAIFDLTGLTLRLGNFTPEDPAFSQTGSTAQFLVYNTALSSTDVAYLMAGFGAQYAITVGP